VAEVLTLERLRRCRAEILGLAQQHRARLVAVFASVARGEARPCSDLDLLVDFEPGASLLDHVGFFWILRNSWASESTSSRGTLSSPRTTTFAPRLWIYDQKPGRTASSDLDHAKSVPKWGRP
jgi:predicted nucleotidyltransferase